MSPERRIEQLERENERLRAALDEKDRFIRQALGSYMTTEVANEVLAQGEGISVSAERREVTMLFSDLRDSTQLSEMMDPHAYIGLLNHYLQDMVMIIDAWQGNVLDFMGDGIVAVFGAPKENEDSARDALCCAVAMQRRMGAVNDWNAAKGYPIIQMGIGVHTGEVVAGTIGSATRLKYDAIGRNVNLASRVEGYTVGGQILATAATVEAAGAASVRFAGEPRWVEPKGIADKVLVYDVTGVSRLLLER